VTKKKDEQPITGMYELLDAVEAVIASADPAKRARWRKQSTHTAKIFQTNSSGQQAHNLQLSYTS
jgi:hypothetical protein